MDFELPREIADLVRARNALRSHYQGILDKIGHLASLHFTLDGNLVGDIGEALAVDLFGIQLVPAKSTEGIDGIIPGSGLTVQVKATGTGRGPAFRNTQRHADYLLFFDLDLESARGSVVYAGPEHYARSMLPAEFSGQRSLSANQIRKAASLIQSEERLHPIEALKSNT